MGDIVRVSKLLSEQGYCSRREADEYIRRGLVEVDGVLVTELGTRAARDQVISLRKEAVEMQESFKTVLLHKPIGYVSHSDDHNRYPSATELLSPENLFQSANGKGGGSSRGMPWMSPTVTSFKGLAPAGRLDIDSTGLLVLTADGRVSKTIIGNNSDMEKEYLVRVRGTLSENNLSLLRYGLSLDGRVLQPAQVKWQNDDQLSFVLREGRKRQIRRMCELVGLSVLALKRVRIGGIPLGNLPVGKWRFLGKSEKF
ncbi:unnamed protein product [Ectocarpus fasciculatus]